VGKLNEEVLQSIRNLYVEFGKPLEKIFPMLGISKQLKDTWVTKNYLGFRDFLREIKDERIVEMARDNMPKLLKSKKEHILSANTQFVLETKGGYNKKSELYLGSKKGFDSKESVEELINNLKGKCDTEQEVNQ
jgi:hypothetical protein